MEIVVKKIQNEETGINELVQMDQALKRELERIKIFKQFKQKAVMVTRKKILVRKKKKLLAGKVVYLRLLVELL